MSVFNRIFKLLLPLIVVTAASIGWSQIAVSGVVVNSITGQPIARALVQIGGHAALTGHDGRFEFENVTDGGAIASKPGYFYRNYGMTPLNQPINLELVPEAIVSGTVTDANGQPIQDLRVQLKTLRARNGINRWEEVQNVVTNAEGEFRFAGLEAGKYSLATAFHMDGLPEAASSVAFVPVVYPPVGGDGSSGALTLKPGDHFEAALNPPVEKVYPVTGSVSGGSGRGVRLEVETADGEMVNPPVRFNRESGTFRVMLPSGSYRVVSHSFVENAQFIGTQKISVSHAPLQGVTVTLQPQPTIPVEVEFQAVNTGAQDAQGTQPNMVNASLISGDRMLEFSAQPAGPPGGQVNGSDRALAIQDVEPGRYTFTVHTPPPWYLASASCGNVDLTRDPLVIGVGVAPCAVHAVLRNDDATLKWSIAPGNAGDHEAGTGQVTVIAIPLGNLAQQASLSGVQRAATVAAQGSFAHLAPGRYLVMALDYRQELAYRDAAALQRYSSLGKEVTLTPNGKSEVQLDMVAGEL